MLSYAQLYNLQPGDVLVISKSGIEIIEHYIIYLGNEIYAENNPVLGVHLLNYLRPINGLLAKRVRRYKGNFYELSCAIARAKSLIGYKYNLTHFNCEHYANYVQYGEKFSHQSANGWGIALLSLLLIEANRNKSI